MSCNRVDLKFCVGDVLNDMAKIAFPKIVTDNLLDKMSDGLSGLCKIGAKGNIQYISILVHFYFLCVPEFGALVYCLQFWSTSKSQANLTKDWEKEPVEKNYWEIFPTPKGALEKFSKKFSQRLQNTKLWHGIAKFARNSKSGETAPSRRAWILFQSDWMLNVNESMILAVRSPVVTAMKPESASQWHLETSVNFEVSQEITLGNH